jgi:hypothetical protein
MVSIDHEPTMNIARSVVMFAIALIPFAACGDQCAVSAAKLAKLIPGVTVLRSHHGDVVDSINLTTSAASEVSIDCPASGSPIDLYVVWSGAFPPGSFYDFVARAAHVVIGAADKDVQGGAELCQQAALMSGVPVHLNRGDAYIECQADSHDDGDTVISVYARKDAPGGADVR